MQEQTFPVWTTTMLSRTYSTLKNKEFGTIE